MICCQGCIEAIIKHTEIVTLKFGIRLSSHRWEINSFVWLQHDNCHFPKTHIYAEPEQSELLKYWYFDGYNWKKSAKLGENTLIFIRCLTL